MITSPVVFVSSTIHDLKDLRSALRYWFDEWGFQSRFSEYNDFPQLPDQNSYESCLRAIDEANYFVLLIGHRVGGWYDKEQHISITQKEYQYAYERAKSGRIKILPFVRRDLWTVLQDRGDVARSIQHDTVLPPEAKSHLAEAIKGYSSKFADEARQIFTFIDEVTRKEEMRKAGSVHASRPPGNWLYPFETFSEIVDTLRVQLGFRHDLRQESMLIRIRTELGSYAGHLLKRWEGKPQPVYELGTPAILQIKGNHNGTSSIRRADLGMLDVMYVLSHVPFTVTAMAIPEAISNGTFLIYDPATNKICPTQFHLRLAELWSELRRLGLSQETGAARQNLMPLLEFAGSQSGDHIEVPNTKLLSHIGQWRGLHKVLHLVTALMRYIDTRDERFVENIQRSPDVLDEYTPKSPFGHLNEADVEAWLLDQHPAGTNAATTERPKP